MLLKHGLYAKAKFHKMEIAFLGYRIGPEGVRMERTKVAAVTEWVEVKGLQRFLGFTNFYRRFIQGFSTIAAPLTDLLKGNKKGKLYCNVTGTQVNNIPVLSSHRS